jgi:hypothetical protein
VQQAVVIPSLSENTEAYPVGKGNCEPCTAPEGEKGKVGVDLQGDIAVSRISAYVPDREERHMKLRRQKTATAELKQLRIPAEGKVHMRGKLQGEQRVGFIGPDNREADKKKKEYERARFPHHFLLL